MAKGRKCRGKNRKKPEKTGTFKESWRHRTPAAGVESGDGVLRVLPYLRWPEAKDDLRLWNAGLNQLRGDSLFGVVFLNPHLAVHNVDVDEGEVDALARIPS